MTLWPSCCTTTALLLLLIALQSSWAFDHSQYAVHEDDYPQDAAIDLSNYNRQQVLLPAFDNLETFPAYAATAGDKMKLADDGKRRGGGLPFGSNGMALRGGQIDAVAGVRQLNVSHRTESSWPDAGIKFGAVAGVSLDRHGNVVIFHRADRVWSEKSFDMNNVYLEKALGAIPTSTVLGIDRRTGVMAYGFGRDLFYMPHGITVDGENNVWVTDVALHQVMKLNRMIAGDSPLMVLGKKFAPGNGRDSFCKPTSVAVLPDGDFFVADGYCNARIIKYNRVGERILEWGKNAFQGRAFSVAPINYFAVPHGLTLALDKGLVCVADRENGRVQCFHHSNGTFHSQYHSQLIGDRLFSVAYAPIRGGQLFVVNGPPLNPSVRLEVKGFVIDMASGNVTAKFPDSANYTNPHDVAVTEDGAEVYVVEYDPYRVHKLVAVDRRLGTGTGASVVGVASKANAAAATSSMRSVLIVTLVVVLGLLVAGATWFVVRQRKRGTSLSTIYQPKQKGRRLDWELFPGKGDLSLAALLEGNRGSAGRRHRKPSTSRGKFRKLGQDSEDEESAAMLRHDSIEERSGEEMA